MEQVGKWIPQSVVGKVTAVDGTDTCTVEPVDGGADLYKVKLRAVIDGATAGSVSIPKVGSFVIVSPIAHDENQLYVSRFSDVDSWHVLTDSGAKVEVKDNGEVHLNGDAFAGIPKLQELEDSLNSLKTYCEAMSAAIGPAFAAVGASPAASGSLGQTSFDAAMVAQSITISPMENEKVKHGNG